MKGLDDYIMGIHLTREDEVPHKCLKCGKERAVRMLFDMGGWFYPDDEEAAFCCGTEMQIIEET